jgi:hypothetical protein
MIQFLLACALGSVSTLAANRFKLYQLSGLQIFVNFCILTGGLYGLSFYGMSLYGALSLSVFVLFFLCRFRTM